MTNDGSANSKWLPVIGRALAYLCMKSESAEHNSLQQRAQFLEGLGLSRADAASMLNTTPASLTELHRQARQKRGKRGTAKAKTKKRRR